MAKKKVLFNVNPITPAVNTERGILFDKLKQGNCFLMRDNLYLKESGCEQIAVNLATGKYKEGLCGIEVIPVSIAITWKKK